MTSIEVKATRTYTVEIGHGLLSSVGMRCKGLLPRVQTACIVSDENVAPLYAHTVQESLEACGIRVCRFVFPAGEESKNGETYLALLDFLARQKITRSDLLLALGGGVVGDLCGFAAASFLRGIAFVQLPTSLLAAVDSSVGGKTAIDLPSGKNLVGAFYQPILVLCDLDTLQTLPPERFAEGCAEMMKYGFLGSAQLLDDLEDGALEHDLEAVVAHCVRQKRDIVERDEFDTGERKLLNLGHTFGHAVEVCSAYQISHGAAVSIGMTLMFRAAIAKGLCPPALLPLLVRLQERFGLPRETSFSAEQLCSVALGDKKREGGSLTLIVPTAKGKSERVQIAVEDVQTWIEMGLQA